MSQSRMILNVRHRDTESKCRMMHEIFRSDSTASRWVYPGPYLEYARHSHSPESKSRLGQVK